MKDSISALLVGESWTSVTSHYKGFDFFTSATYEGDGAANLRKELEKDTLINFTAMPSHAAAENFPYDIEGLKAWDVIIFSDIGANTLLLDRHVFQSGQVRPNRLAVIRDWVASGGVFGMCGGYLSFSGFEAKAKYYRTVIEEILPVSIHTFDDRVETPEGMVPQVKDPHHPILEGVATSWPVVLGYQETIAKEDAHVLVETPEGRPFLAIRQYGKGMTLAWMTDIGPHWCPTAFTEWEGFGKIWRQALKWLVTQTRRT